MVQGAFVSSVWKGHGDVVRVFVEKGVEFDVNKKDGLGRTLISQACWRENEAVVDVLLEHGADVFEKDEDGYSPLSYSLQSKLQPILHLFRSHLLANHTFSHPHTDSYPNLNVFTNHKIEKQAFLFHSLRHPLSKRLVKEYMDVIGCVRNGVFGFLKKYGLGVRKSEGRRCGLKVIVRRKDLTFDLYRLLLFWEAEDGFYIR